MNEENGLRSVAEKGLETHDISFPRSWIVSNALIDRLSLTSIPYGGGLIVRGEDDNWYELDEILRKVLNAVDTAFEDLGEAKNK